VATHWVAILFGVKDMTTEEIIAAILECKEKLGRVPTRAELAIHYGVSRQEIRRLFRTYGRALRECNLQKAHSRRLEIKVLFEDWAQVVRQLKKIPSAGEYEELSQYSYRPLVTRFGSWTKVPAGLKQYAEEQGLGEECKDIIDLITACQEPHRGRPALVARPSRAEIMTDRPLYGRLMRPCPMLCKPTTEAGVMFLFGAEALRLGFMVLQIQTEFPDCEAMREVGEDKLQRVRIEFEYQSRNFLRHAHDAKKCDLIVCWEHNWAECPLEVISLREEIGTSDDRDIG
jgi:hypothetical protein